MNKSELSLELFFPEFCFEEQSMDLEQFSDLDKLSDSERLSALDKLSDSERFSDSEKFSDLERLSDSEKLSDFERLSDSETVLSSDLPGITEAELALYKELKLDQSFLLSNLLFELAKLILSKEKIIQQFLSEQELSARIDVELITGQSMRHINLSTRGIDETTDVLSFPNFSFAVIHKSRKAKKCEIADIDFTIEPYAWLDPTAEYGTISLGEILICPLKAQEQAIELAHSLIREVCFLFMHGLLHLCGYDHQTEQEASRMFDLQKNILPELENLINTYFEGKYAK
ncbi:MAG: rRNA maturation RNase YbeY [Clostridiaceae bacterium]|nr:rRNA maturation RNase YbeY [Clostridiaceae bacterium]